MDHSKNLSRFIKEIGKAELLSREEEVVLMEKIKNGCSLSKKRLIKAHLPFVIKMASQFKTNILKVEDLIQEGCRGLVDSTIKFDIKRKKRFLSYAGYWIRKRILKAIYNKERLIRLPENKMELLKRIRDAKRRLEKNSEQPVSIREVHEILEIRKDEITDIYGSLEDDLDTPVTCRPKNNADTDMEDFLDEDSINGEDLLRTEDEQNRFNYLLSLLTEKQRKVIILYFGINSLFPISLEEIASRLRISPQMARLHKEAALKKLRKFKFSFPPS